MKKNKFRGWGDVFSFTYAQSVKKGSFRAVTLVIALLLAAGIALIVVVTAKPDGKEAKDAKSEIQDVYVNDPYGIDYEYWAKMLGYTYYREVNFETAGSRSEAIDKAVSSGRRSYVVVEVTMQDSEEGVLMEAFIPENSSVRESEAEDLLSAMSVCFETGKLFLAGLSMEQLVGVATPAVTDYTEIGKDGSVVIELIRIFAPMIFGLVLYMMLLLYGQNVSREVSVEKTSKLTETLLTSVRPNALIAGKVLAVTVTAILQTVIWVLGAVAGLLIGNAIAKSMYPGYENVILSGLNFLRDNIGASAFSPAAIVLAILSFVIGFFFYNVIAGVAGCFASKPEDVAQVNSIFIFPIIISFFACYFGILLEKDSLMAVCRLVPFTIPFCVPVDVLTGTISILQGAVSLAILTAFALLMIVLSSKIYEGLILYNGQKLNLKTAIRVITAKK